MARSRNTINVKEGLGGASASFDKAAGVIGISSIVPSGIVTISSLDEIEKKFGEGPLRDFLVDAFSFESPGVCYVKAIQGSINGVLNPIIRNERNRGLGTINVSGNPRNDYDIVIEIIQDGGLNNGGFQVVVDDRLIVKPTTIPEDGIYQLGNTGITLTFNTTAGDFEEGDIFSFSTTAPSATNEDLLNALDELLAEKKRFRLVAVASVTRVGFWSAFDTRLGLEVAKNRFLHGITLGRDKRDNETIDEYVNAMTNTERGTIQCKRVGVVLSYAAIVDAQNGNTDIRNVGGKYLGWLLWHKIQESPGKTENGAIGGILDVRRYDEGGGKVAISGGQLDLLDNAGFLTITTYFEKDGIYFTSGRMLVDMSSDFAQIQNRAVMDKACTKVAEALFVLFQKEVRFSPSGEIAGIKSLESVGQRPLNSMSNPLVNEISSGTFIIPTNQNILSDKLLRYFVKIIPLGYIHTLEGEISFYNPFISGGK